MFLRTCWTNVLSSDVKEDEQMNKIIRLPPPTHKQLVGRELDEIGILIMLGEAAVANNPDDFVMGKQLKSLKDREEQLKLEYDALP